MRWVSHIGSSGRIVIESVVCDLNFFFHRMLTLN